MAPLEEPLTERLALVDAVDHLLNRGAVLVGQTTLSLAGVDLVYLGLNLLVSSVETLREREPGAGAPGPLATTTGGALAARSVVAQPPVAAKTVGPRPGALGSVVRDMLVEQSPSELLAGLPGRTEADAGESPERGLARLVLTLVELLRQILERQAVRRMEGGGLAAEEIERMGLALMELEAKMVELRAVFGLEEGDLNLDLGPLGDLL
ncbi:MAG TPA: gas vesicle protein GvpJ [Chloroflexota bacterium]|nr:gas vesicle protein GvpJ [Chloroflexota bacterium]